MATMDVSVLLRLVDQLSGPAKKATESLRQLTETASKLKSTKNVFGDLNRNAGQISSTMGRMTRDIQQLNSAYARLANQSRSAMNATMSMNGQSGAWARQQTQALNQLAAAQRQIIANHRAMNRGTSQPPHGGPNGYYIGHGGLAGHRLAQAARQGLAAGGMYDAEVTRAKMAGRSPAELRQMEDEAGRVARIVPRTSVSDAMRIQSEMIELFGAFDKMREMVQPFATTNALLKINGASTDGQAFALAKALDDIGATNDPTRAKALLTDWSKVIVATRGRLTGDQIMMATQYMRGTKFGANDYFMGRVLPALISGNPRASSVGNELASLGGMVVSNRVAKEKIPDLVAAGLVDPKKVVQDGHGPNKKRLLPGAFYGSDEYLQNPFEWVNKYLGRAIEAKGLKSESEVATFIATLTGNRVTGEALASMYLQRDQIRRSIGLYSGAQDPATALKTSVTGDFWAAGDDAARKFETAMQPFTGPLMQAATVGLNSLASAMTRIADAGKAMNDISPWLAGGVGAAVGAGGLAAVAASPMLRLLFGAGIGGVVGGAPGAAFGAILARMMPGLAPIGGGAAAGAAGGAAGSAAAAGGAAAVGAAGGSRVLSLLGAGARVGGVAAGAAGAVAGSALGAIEVYRAHEQLAGLTLGERLRLRNGGASLIEMRRDRYLGDRESMGVPASPHTVPQPVRPPAIEAPVAPESVITEMIAKIQGWVSKMRAEWSTTIQGPHLAPPTGGGASGAGAAGGGGGGTGTGKQSMLHKAVGTKVAGSRAVTVGDIHVHGSSDPQQTARAVHKRFNEAVYAQLSDGLHDFT
jgi:hypothetical protein